MKDIVKILGGIFCLALAEWLKRASFIASDWEGKIAGERLLLAFSVIMISISLFVGLRLVYEGGSGILFRRRLVRSRKRLFNYPSDSEW